MPTFRSGDAQLFYETAGSGPDVVLLHPFPLNHHFWDPVADQLSVRYRVLLPDLRAHGDSELGAVPRPCKSWPTIWHGSAGKSALSRPSSWAFRSAAICCLILAPLSRASTRARARQYASGAETSESKATRSQLADKIEREGTAGFVEEMLSKLLAQATRSNRPDIVDAARKMMQAMSPPQMSLECNGASLNAPIR